MADSEVSSAVDSLLSSPDVAGMRSVLNIADFPPSSMSIGDRFILGNATGMWTTLVAELIPPDIQSAQSGTFYAFTIPDKFWIKSVSLTTAPNPTGDYPSWGDIQINNGAGTTILGIGAVAISGGNSGGRETLYETSTQDKWFNPGTAVYVDLVSPVEAYSGSSYGMQLWIRGFWDDTP